MTALSSAAGLKEWCSFTLDLNDGAPNAGADLREKALLLLGHEAVENVRLHLLVAAIEECDAQLQGIEVDPVLVERGRYQVKELWR